jgi:hypothetical protein
VAAPEISVEQVRHLLNSALTHVGTHNKSEQDMHVAEAVVSALLLVAQELDQIGDILAYQAGLKTREDIELT